MSEQHPGPAGEHDGHVAEGTRSDRVLAGLLPRRVAAAVCWCVALVVVGGTVWLVAQALAQVMVVVVAVAVGLLLTALLAPLDGWLRRALPRALAALASVAVLLALLAGIATLIGLQVADRSSDLVAEFSGTISSVRDLLVDDRLPLPQVLVDRAEASAQAALQAASQQLTGTLVTVGTFTVDLVTGALLVLFVVLLVLWDAGRIWTWVLGLVPSGARSRVDEGGRAAWVALSGFVQGTFVIASIHAVVIGTVLHLVGVPLFVPLALLVFLGSFVPVVGAFVAGGVAVVVTLGTQGVVPAVVVLAVLLFENELEAHVLQPFIVGRYVRLHPLAIILVLAVGSYTAGVVGALLAVPLAGSARAAWGPLNGRPSVVPVHQPSRLTRLRRRWRRRRAGRTSADADAGPPGR